MPIEGIQKMQEVDPHYTNQNWDQQFAALKKLVGLANTPNSLYVLIRAFSQSPNQITGQIHVALANAPDQQYPSQEQINDAISFVHSIGATSQQINAIATFFSDNYDQLRQNN